MTSTVEVEQDLCGCGCGAVILPTDNHPWFKTRSCQMAWGLKPGLSAEERQVWMWAQRFYFCTVNNVPWGTAVDWDFEYTDKMVIDYANTRIGESRVGVRPLDPSHPTALEDALRILTWANWKANAEPHKWKVEDKLPPWVFTVQRITNNMPPDITEALRQYGIVPFNQSGPSA